MAQASLSTGSRSHLLLVLYREVPHMAQASLSTSSWSHLLLCIKKGLQNGGLFNFLTIDSGAETGPYLVHGINFQLSDTFSRYTVTVSQCLQGSLII